MYTACYYAIRYKAKSVKRMGMLRYGLWLMAFLFLNLVLSFQFQVLRRVGGLMAYP